MTAKELLPLIKAKGKGDRLSENLMKWVKKWEKTRGNRPLSVAFLHWSNIDGSHVEYAVGTTQPNHILIGDGDNEGWFYGHNLSHIIGGGRGSADVFAYPPKMLKTSLSNWFEDYIKGGKCFIDPEHRLYHDKERWQLSEDGNTRNCLWCGEVAQHKIIKERIVCDISWEAK